MATASGDRRRPPRHDLDARRRLPGLCDESLLESALARPKQILAYNAYADIAALAAAYAHGLARNHPYSDSINGARAAGKRTTARHHVPEVLSLDVPRCTPVVRTAL